MLNAYLQEELDNLGYKLDTVKPAYQKSLINIMTTRLARAFYNDELLPRNSQVSYSQQGGVQYASNSDFSAKNSLYEFSLDSNSSVKISKF